MTTAGGSVTRLTNDPATGVSRAGRRTARSIAFSSDRANRGVAGAFDIYVMGAPNGSNQLRLTSLTGDDKAPYWLDGSRLVFSSTQLPGLAIVAPTGGTSTKIPSTAAGDANPG